MAEEMGTFEQRKARHEDELRWLYFELFGENHQAFDYFLYVLEESYRKRSEDLKKWDEKLCCDPQAFCDNWRFGMQVDVAAFAKDIKGVRKNLSYFVNAGVNMLHLMNTKAAPDLKELAEDCHSEGIRLSLDPDFASTPEGEYQNPTVFNDRMTELLNICNYGVDVICLKTGELHSRLRILRMATEIVCPGTLILAGTKKNELGAVSFFGTREKPECHLVMNTTAQDCLWHTVATQDVRLLQHELEGLFRLPKCCVYYNRIRSFDAIRWKLDYDFLSQFGVDEIQHKQFLNDYYRGIAFGSGSRGELYRNDLKKGETGLCGTTASLCGIETAEKEENPDKLDQGIALDIMLHAFVMTLSGVPMICCGDEIGKLNDESYRQDPEKRSDNRFLHRGPFPWDEAALKDDDHTRPGRIFDAIRSLQQYRRKHRVFDNAADIWVIPTENDRVLGIGRYLDGEKLVAFFNFSRQSQLIYTEDTDVYRDFATGERRLPSAVELTGYSFVWYYKKFD